MKNTNQESQLTSEQVVHFYQLWFGVLQFANEEQKLVPSMLGKNFSDGVDTGDAGKIAWYLWKHPQVFNNYIKKYDLSNEEATIIKAWRDNHFKGKFYIVRYLKNGAVFLSAGKEEKPYLIKGLASDFEEMWPRQVLPFLVETVLLPFEGVITTCGLYYSSNIMFGRGITRDIRESCQ
ncbi:MAG: hypothetical protein COY80_02870 [Candidatus Pacebacteria bacterium CG_4_10_14_0_8_um_filter_42_14]|nr:MAG: hypothetical protein COY80_02870 [Candidatus Pacebacteria bacterium CG_4_10_14_0_8_um_filter_42_14]